MQKKPKILNICIALDSLPIYRWWKHNYAHAVIVII